MRGGARRVWIALGGLLLLLGVAAYPVGVYCWGYSHYRAAEQALQRALAQEHRTIPAQHHEGRPPPGRALSLFLAIGQHLGQTLRASLAA